MKRKQYDRGLKEIQRHIQHEEYQSAVADCGRLFERAMRELLVELEVGMRSGRDREQLLKVEREQAKGSDKTFQDFGLGELVGLYRGAKLWDKLRRAKTSNLKLTARIPWSEVVELRNAAIHKDGEYDGGAIEEAHADLMLFHLKAFLYETELAGGGRDVPEGPQAPGEATECRSCEAALDKSWRFCPICGTPVYTVCTSCDRQLQPDWKRCPYCEAPVRGKGSPERQAAAYEYELLCRGAYLDNAVNARERTTLNEKRLQLGISLRQAAAIERKCAPREVLEYQRFLEGVYVDGVVNDHERRFLEKKRAELGLDPATAEQLEEQYRAETQDGADKDA